MTIVRKLMMNSQCTTRRQIFLPTEIYCKILSQFQNMTALSSFILISFILFVYREEENQVKGLRNMLSVSCLWSSVFHAFIQESFFCYLHYDQFIIFVHVLCVCVMQKLNLRHYIVCELRIIVSRNTSVIVLIVEMHK